MVTRRPRGAGGARRRRGLVIPLVVLAILLFGIYALTLITSSQGEYRLTKKTANLARAKEVARAGLAHASALIFQNDFENRWYKMQQGPHGFYGTLEGTVGSGAYLGTYKVVAEDIANEMPAQWQGDEPEAKALRLEGLKYNRIDLFSEGTFGDTRVIVYQAVVLYPEERVYSFTKEDSGGFVQYTDVRIR